MGQHTITLNITKTDTPYSLTRSYLSNLTVGGGAVPQELTIDYTGGTVSSTQAGVYTFDFDFLDRYPISLHADTYSIAADGSDTVNLAAATDYPGEITINIYDSQNTPIGSLETTDHLLELQSSVSDTFRLQIEQIIDPTWGVPILFGNVPIYIKAV